MKLGTVYGFTNITSQKVKPIQKNLFVCVCVCVCVCFIIIGA